MQAAAESSRACLKRQTILKKTKMQTKVPVNNRGSPWSTGVNTGLATGRSAFPIPHSAALTVQLIFSFNLGEKILRYPDPS